MIMVVEVIVGDLVQMIGPKETGGVVVVITIHL